MEDYLESHNIPSILKGMVTQMCVHKPPSPVEFMVKYLQDNYLKKANGTDIKRGDSIDYEGESMCDEERIVEPDSLKRKRRGAICCEPPKSASGVNSFTPKDKNTQEYLDNALKKNIMFSHLEDDQRAEVFGAMFEVFFKAGDIIIRQGDEGDNFYVVAEGVCDVYVSKQGGEPALVTSYTLGGAFGELALIYGSPRAATVKAKTDVRLWAINRVTYRNILMETTMRKRKMYEGFLENVPILAQMTKYERVTVADALEPTFFPAGEVIVRQGDPGEKFYIIVEGEVKVIQSHDGAEPVEVAILRPPHYFGEIALLTNRPRAATVVAVGDTKCAQLDRDAFIRLLGPCENILRRNMENYNRIMSNGI